MERPFAHQFETERLRWIFFRGHPNVHKRLLVHVCGFNLGPLTRYLTGFGTPRSPQGRTVASIWAPLAIERLGAFAEALLRVDTARSVDSRVPNPSLRYLNVNVRIEH